jgi:hypothetical protein
MPLALRCAIVARATRRTNWNVPLTFLHITSPILFWATLLAGLLIGFAVKGLLIKTASKQNPAK